MKDCLIKLSDLKHLKVEFIKNEYVVTLIDDQEYEILNGYGPSIPNAINDLLSNLFYLL
jgi:hypothetical protein